MKPSHTVNVSILFPIHDPSFVFCVCVCVCVCEYYMLFFYSLIIWDLIDFSTWLIWNNQTGDVPFEEPIDAETAETPNLLSSFLLSFEYWVIWIFIQFYVPFLIYTHKYICLLLIAPLPRSTLFAPLSAMYHYSDYSVGPSAADGCMRLWATKFLCNHHCI